MPAEIDFANARISTRFVERIPIHFARRFAIIGLDDQAGTWIDVLADTATADATIDNLSLILGTPVRRAHAARDTVLELIDRAYQQQSVDVQATVAGLNAVESHEIQLLSAEGDLLDNNDRAPVVKLVNQVLFEAIRRRASDVHVQPSETEVWLRLRVDGMLIDYLRLGRSFLEELVSRIKVMGGLDIAETRIPQDGRATVRMGPRLIDLRISMIPTAHGERAVLRLLDKGARQYRLDRLGMPPSMRSHFEAVMSRTHGLVLMTGPTGSGKSTTLYAALQHIDLSHSNVLTLEDPIEYHLPGISQTQVAQRKGMTFATGLRSVLRQDPDVIMVGEIRDTETARLAVQSALTGHLVLSTLHTNDACGAVARMLDLGVEPYLVADALIAVGAQRLVRINCAGCSATRTASYDEYRQLGLDESDQLRVVEGRGCIECSGTGFHGREGIFELLVIDDAMREAVHRGVSATELRLAAAQRGFGSLRQDGIEKIRAGRTTPAEVLRVTQRELISVMDPADSAVSTMDRS